MIEYREFDSAWMESVREIYQSGGWRSYLQDDGKLRRAFDQSLYLLGAFDRERLVGFARCVGDGEHILLVQDLIVLPEYQKRGIGSRLFQMVMDQYSGVRMFMLVTDIEDEVDNKFYQSFGLKRLEEKHMVGYIR